ncbi:tetraspanin Tsp2 family [Mycena galericulata]|nr:tetraspanin Tsp2 family [Mycena galericulata]
MEYRAPSSLATAKDGVLRRRSGVYAPQDDETENEVDMIPSDLHGPPTVLLVRRVPSFTPHPALPRLSSRSPSPPPGSTPPWSPAPVDNDLDRSASLVPLTPRPDAPQREHSATSLQSASSSASTVPPLPTPDFTRPPRFLGLLPRGLSYLSNVPRPFFSRTATSERPPESEGSVYSDVSPLPTPMPMPDFPHTPGFLSLLPRGLSYFSHAPSFFSSRASMSQLETEEQRHPLTLRSESEGSSSCGSATNSIDSGHHALIKSVGTTEKFTHKWPRPQSLRTYSAEDGPVVAGASPGVLEDGRGVSVDDAAEPWTGFKWCLLLSVCTVFVYGTAALVCALMTWFRTWDQADVMFVADNDILVLITLAGSILVFTALVGFSGVLLNSRPILAVYTLLLWPAFVSIVAIGYVGYKRATFALDHKLNMSWSQYYTPLGRLLIQDALRCCGFYTALHEATPSARCYPRTALPGCKGKLYRFERANLAMVWSTVFALVPLHLLNLLIALLCANHVTETFGRGITPKMYRLTRGDVQADAEKIMRGVRQLDGMSLERPELRRDTSGGTYREGVDGEDKVPFLSYEGHQY